MLTGGGWGLKKNHRKHFTETSQTRNKSNVKHVSRVSGKKKSKQNHIKALFGLLDVAESGKNDLNRSGRGAVSSISYQHILHNRCFQGCESSLLRQHKFDISDRLIL